MDQASGRRAGGPDAGPEQHRRRAQVEGAGEIDRRGRQRRTRPPARPRLRRRTQPDLGEPDRQRPRRRSRIRPRRGAGEPRATSASSCASSTTAPAFRRRSASASSIRSSPPSRSGKAPALGLDIVRRLVRHNDGEIERRVAAGPDGVPRRRCRSPTSTAPEERLNKPVLLIVDDDPQVLAAVRRDLRSRYREHYTVISAASGEEALDDRPRAEEPRRFAGHGDQRSADAGHAGERSARQIARRLPAGAARAAHRLLGHRRGRSRPSTRRISITICRSRGIRPRNVSSRWSTISSTPGRPSICPRRRD